MEINTVLAAYSTWYHTIITLPVYSCDLIEKNEHSLNMKNLELSISKQLLLGVVVSSSLITFLVTVLQIFQEHQSQIKITLGQFDTLMHTNKKGLENSIWDLNEAQIDSILFGMNNFHKVDYLQLKYESEDGERLKDLGERVDNFVSKEYLLSFKDKKIGTLSFYSNKDRIINHLRGAILYILFVNFVKTFIASFLILGVINFLLTKHLLSITSYLNQGNLNRKKLELKRRYKFSANDELSLLVQSINSLLEKSRRNTEILEIQVKKRTEQLNKQLKVSLTIQHALDLISMYVHLSNDGGIKSYNHKFCEAFCRDKKNIQGNNFLSHLFFEKDELEFTKRKFEEGKSWSAELKILNKKQKSIWVSINAIPAHEIHGEGSGHYLILSDITSKKNQQFELEKARLKSMEAVRAKSQFLANISHELRTPMNGIIGIIDSILISCEDQKLGEQLELVENCGSTLLDLINDILDFSKMEEGKLELESIEFNISKSVDNVIKLLALKAEDRGNTLDVLIRNNVPKIIYGDSTRFKQVLMNIVNNAIKFTKNGKIYIHIDSKKSSHDTYLLQIDVTDNGVGIGKDNLRKVFEPFVQEDSSTSRRFGGSGLGLSISQSIVKLMGGDIWVESQLGEGSKFSFNFPAKANHKQTFTEDTTQEKPQKIIEPKPLSILLAEDNEVNQIVFQSLLERFGYTCDICFNGREVLDKVKEKEYDVIFMDCQMPIMNGYEATKELLKSDKRPLIVALTANALKEDKEQCFEAGMDYFISKPIRAKDLEICLIKMGSHG